MKYVLPGGGSEQWIWQLWIAPLILTKKAIQPPHLAKVLSRKDSNSTKPSKEKRRKGNRKIERLSKKSTNQKSGLKVYKK